LARKTNGKPQLPTKNWHWLLNTQPRPSYSRPWDGKGRHVAG
jgi:hypothetical protein